MEIRFGSFVRAREFGGPGCDQLTFHDQPAAARTLDNGDSQHAHQVPGRLRKTCAKRLERDQGSGVVAGIDAKLLHAR